MLGFMNENDMKAFFESKEVNQLSSKIAKHCSAVHAYEVREALLFVENGTILSKFREV